MPDELADFLILYGSKPGDTVLDPWAGSGTTLCRAKALGRHYVGYELVPEYARLSEERISRVQFGEALGNQGVIQKPQPALRPSDGDVGGRSESQPRSCRHCGTSFIAKKPWQRFCKRACHDAHHNATPKKEKNNGKEQNR
jgi:hypothetical protein